MNPLLVDGPLVIGMTRPDDLTESGAVLVEDGRITALHDEARRRAKELEAGDGRVERLAGTGLWLLPGFVATHVHLCQTLLRNGPDDLALLPWLAQHVWPGEAAHDEETLEVSARLGLAELAAGGVTSVLDMGTVRHTDAIFRAAAASGLRVTSGNALMDDPATNPPDLFEASAPALAETERLLGAWHGREEGRLRVAYCPRFAVSCTDALLREAGRRAASNGVLVHTHASENLEEVVLVRERTGRANVAYLADAGLLGPHVVLAHAIHTDDTERALLASSGTHVAHCPTSNLKLASGICPVPEYLTAGINVTLGPDGAPCNDRLDPFAEMRLAALLQKPRLGPGVLGAWEVVRMATSRGAAALGLADETGTIEVGKRADFVLLDKEEGFARPVAWRDDPYGPLVYSFDRTNVVATYVDGVRRHHRTLHGREDLKPSALEIDRAMTRLRARRKARTA
jgi:5-methylthioadenosine/S-adenosylhomocysteine deaminase